MDYLVDTSVLGRRANRADAQHKEAARAIRKLHRQGHTLRVAPQSLVEFRNFATRPTTANGLGLSPALADARMAGFESRFPLIPETPAIFAAWRALVQTAGVVGKQVHDARLVAVCQVNSISHILTFNTSHFTTLAKFVPNLTIIHPASV